MASCFPKAILGFVIFAAWPCATAFAAPTVEQSKAVQDLRRSLVRAGKLYKVRRFRESVKVVKQVQQQLDTLPVGDNAELERLTAPIYKSLERAHALLELEGFSLPPLRKPTANREPDPATSPGGISFVREIAPILVEHCGGCHMKNAKGDFSMSNFTSLMRGPTDAGKVVFAGDAQGSRLIEVIESGDMPRGGGKVAVDQLKALRMWIDQGAKYDGSNARAPLTRLVDKNRPAQPKTQSIARAQGDESVRFSLELAPVLAQRCTECHGEEQAAGGLRVDTFSRLMSGGDSGPVVQSGRANQSLLINKIKGTAPGERMPAGRPALPEEIISKFATWVTEGAKFDGTSPDVAIALLAELVFAKEATPDEMSSKRTERANAYWELGMPGITRNKAESKHFLLIGNIGEETLDVIGKMAEKQWKKMPAAMKLSPDQSPLKGQVTIFVFERRYDYSEFGKMVEAREVPLGSIGHWRYGILDAYAAILAGHKSPDDYQFNVSHQLAGVLVGSQGDSPPWFAEGTARVIAASLDSRAEAVRQWERELAQATKSMTRADDFIVGRLEPEQSNLVSYGFVKFLRKNARSYHRLIHSIRGGQDFSTAFAAEFGAPPEEIAQKWWMQSSRSR